MWAISAETGETTWLHEQLASTQALVATGGRLVFGGDGNGRFRAFDQETGEVLWEINLGSPVRGFPITYAVDGQQYLAVPVGTDPSLWSGISGQLTPEKHRPAVGGHAIVVFTLPE